MGEVLGPLAPHPQLDVRLAERCFEFLVLSLKFGFAAGPAFMALCQALAA